MYLNRLENILCSNYETKKCQAEELELFSQLSPYVRRCGNDRRPTWEIKQHCLLDYLLVYIEEGSGSFNIAGVKYNARGGDLFWIPPNVVIRMGGNAPSMVCPYVHFDLVYHRQRSHWDFSIPPGLTDLSKLKQFLHPSFKLPALNKLCGRIASYNNKVVGNLISRICSEAFRSQPFARLKCNALLLEIIAEILRGQKGIDSDMQKYLPLLEEAAEYLSKNFIDRRAIQEAAKLCELSESYFRRIFKNHYGCSPRRYQRLARIYQVKRLMQETTMNLGEIAIKTHFASVHSLSRAFKQVEGITASEYRKCSDFNIHVEGRCFSNFC